MGRVHLSFANIILNVSGWAQLYEVLLIAHNSNAYPRKGFRNFIHG